MPVDLLFKTDNLSGETGRLATGEAALNAIFALEKSLELHVHRCLLRPGRALRADSSIWFHVDHIVAGLEAELNVAVVPRRWIANAPETLVVHESDLAAHVLGDDRAVLLNGDILLNASHFCSADWEGDVSGVTIRDDLDSEFVCDPIVSAYFRVHSTSLATDLLASADKCGAWGLVAKVELTVSDWLGEDCLVDVVSHLGRELVEEVAGGVAIRR